MESHPRTSHGTFQDTQGLLAAPPPPPIHHGLKLVQLIELIVYPTLKGSSDRSDTIHLLLHLFDTYSFLHVTTELSKTLQTVFKNK